MRHLIVNADDFGLSRGVSDGILEAHERGIVTSTSLMVDAPDAARAAKLCQARPTLSVGLHVTLTDEYGRLARPAAGWAAELARQFDRFVDRTGRSPTHIDSHHNVHRNPRLSPHFIRLATSQDLPLREHSQARYVSRYYAQWDGQTHPEQVDRDGLRQILKADAVAEVTELGCHPGRVCRQLDSVYARERELELATLCDPRARDDLAVLNLMLISFADLRAAG